jgi:hypothetical protein
MPRAFSLGLHGRVLCVAKLASGTRNQRLPGGHCSSSRKCYPFVPTSRLLILFARWRSQLSLTRRMSTVAAWSLLSMPGVPVYLPRIPATTTAVSWNCPSTACLSRDLGSCVCRQQRSCLTAFQEEAPMKVGVPFNPYKVFQGGLRSILGAGASRDRRGSQALLHPLARFRGQGRPLLPSLETLGASLGCRAPDSRLCQRVVRGQVDHRRPARTSRKNECIPVPVDGGIGAFVQFRSRSLGRS